MIDTAPMVIVDTVGVRNLRWILAKADGIDLYTAIDSVVRAVGRMVVWVDAAAELNTMSSNRWLRKLPKPDEPKMEPPRTESTSPWWAGLPRPTPLVPRPAYDWEDSTTSS